MRELVFLSCDMSAAPKAGSWAQDTLRRAGVSARIARSVSARLTEAFTAAVRAFRDAGERRGEAQQMMLVLSDDSGELAFELIADGDRREQAFERKDAALGAAWEAVERRVAGDGVTCLRMRAGT